MSSIKPSVAPKILIATSSLDELNCAPVAELLRNRGYDVIIYRADKVADGSVPLAVKIGREAGLHVSYDGSELRMDSIVAAWYRRPAMFAREQNQDNKVRQLGLDNERNMIQYSLWNAVPEKRWLNPPQRISHADHKLTQLVLASELGFNVPETVVTNKWDFIRDNLPDRIVFKTSYGFMYSQDKLKVFYTTLFANDPAHLPISSNPFPGFWQSNLTKAREWRITIVGDQTFDAAIYTDEAAKDDWRIHQDKPTVQFKRETFPNDQKILCFKYLEKLGLKFGAFDFIENPDGIVTFLECNANGQYGWLEHELGYSISSAIADELIKISRENS